MLVYLDSSAIVKRYIEEIGSESVDLLYSSLELEQETDNLLVFSSWNLGEVFGAIDTRHQRRDIDEKSMNDALDLFYRETRKFVTMRKLEVRPMGARVLSKSRELVLKYHIYQADAVQLASAKQAGAQLFVSADRKLLDCAKLERLAVANPERDLGAIQNAITAEKTQ
jgi:predicted nucleic acid-binding protein